ncbi:TonB-dependent receptor [Roseateles sp. BYS96W]|uniref:TonB-dependent receptor n=1 Tax=Pelomonas nitida TaxID=3299027 RepID=A0ABW7G847_9BURK
MLGWNRLNWVAPLGLVAGLLGTSPAVAADVEAAPAGTAGRPDGAVEGTAPGVTPGPTAAQRLEAVTVTGDKLRRAELDSTQSVGLRNRRQIEESASDSVRDVIGRMANVGTALNLSIRGIPLYGPTGGDGKTATVSVDGVPQEGAGQALGDLSVWDAEAVEVLRGPQSTNQGRNALAGAVILRTRNPTDDWDLRGRASAGHLDARRLAVAGGGPLVKDRVAFRVAVEDRRSDGDLVNETRHERRWNRDDARSFRGKLRLTPTDGDYQALVSYSDATHDQGRSFAELTLRRAEQRVSLANEPANVYIRSRNLGIEQTWRALGVEWTWLSSWALNRYEREFDYDDTEANQGVSQGSFVDRRHSQELRANFSASLWGRPLAGVAGVYWAQGPSLVDSSYQVPVSYVLNTLGRCKTLAACEASYPADFVLRRNLGDQRLRNRAVFGEFDYRMGPWTLTTGLRYDHEAQDRLFGSQTAGNTAMATSIVTLLLNNKVIAPDGDQTLQTRFSSLLPKLALRYQLNPDWMVGATVQRGYRTGGVNYSYQRGANTFDPEYTTNYEFSLKGQPLPGVLLSGNVFRIDWRDQQVNIGANSLDVFYVNAGKSRLQGLELEMRGPLTPALEVFAALGLSRSEFLAFQQASVNYTGKQFASSPRQTASLGASWKPGAWRINADVAYQGSRFSDTANTAALRNPGSVTLNAKLAYALTPKLRWFADGSNLLDRTYTVYRAQATPSRLIGRLGDGRRIGVGVEAEL